MIVWILVAVALAVVALVALSRGRASPKVKEIEHVEPPALRRMPIPPAHPEAPAAGAHHEGPVQHEGDWLGPLHAEERGRAHRLDPRTVVLDYEDAAHHETHRLVDVKGVRQLDGATYLVAFCHLRNEVRTFRLDRVRGVARGDTGEVIDLAAWLPVLV